MLCWGHSAFGQLGIGHDLQAVVNRPQACGFFRGRRIKEVACGGYHSAFLLEDGEIYTCGLNSKGQLGHYSDGREPEQVEALAEEDIVHVACGELHSLAVSSNGQLFSWGASSDGQLGHATMEISVSIPSCLIYSYEIFRRTTHQSDICLTLATGITETQSADIRVSPPGSKIQHLDGTNLTGKIFLPQMSQTGGLVNIFNGNQ